MDSQHNSTRHSKKNYHQSFNSSRKEKKGNEIKGAFPNSFYAASITLKANPGKDVKMQHRTKSKRKEAKASDEHRFKLSIQYLKKLQTYIMIKLALLLKFRFGSIH